MRAAWHGATLSQQCCVNMHGGGWQQLWRALCAMPTHRALPTHVQVSSRLLVDVAGEVGLPVGSLRLERVL